MTGRAELGHEHLRRWNACADQLIARRGPSVEKPMALARRCEAWHGPIRCRRHRSGLEPLIETIDAEPRALEALHDVRADFVATPADRRSNGRNEIRGTAAELS